MEHYPCATNQKIDVSQKEPVINSFMGNIKDI